VRGGWHKGTNALMANDGWLSRFLEDLKFKKKDLVPVGGCLNTPGAVVFDFKSDLPVEGGLIFWAFEREWNSCKGGDGFEVGLSNNRLRVSGMDGTKISDIKYTLPLGKTLVETYQMYLKFDTDRFTCTITPLHSPKNCIRLQVLTEMPKRVWVGTGSPPGAGNGVPELTISDFRIT